MKTAIIYALLLNLILAVFLQKIKENMMKNTFIHLFNRDIQKLYEQISAYENQENLWRTVEGINNSAGNLCLHLIGNLNEYIGRQLGQIPFVRNRPLEFSEKNISKITLTEQILATQKIVETALSNISDAQMTDIYPEKVLGNDMTIHYFLVHLHGHLNYHLGQIDYHRRILTAV